jgi:dual oxidase
VFQLNELTPYIDGNLMYGTSPAWTDLLRRFANGTIAPDGQLAWSEDHGPSFPPINKVNVPMFNPPPPSLHDEFVKKHQTLPASRHFSEFKSSK